MPFARRVGPAAFWAAGAAPWLVLVLGLTPGCRTLRKPEAARVPVAPAPPAPPPEAEPPQNEDPQLTVKAVPDQIVVAAWAEPKSLPAGGGQAQLLVRVQKRGGAAYPGVEVRFKTSTGSLYSGGKVLTTDKLGLTRDRLTARKTATITLNAGGTRYTFQVPVGE
jgi:hypothetical protein